MEKQEMLQRLSKLESINDHLSAEIEYLDQLMKNLGFAQGIATVKATAEEIIEDYAA